jgi:hypothetical protein
MQTPSRLALILGLAALAVQGMSASFLARRNRGRRPHGHGKELKEYRADVSARSARIDKRLSSAAETIDALRRRALEVDEAVQALQAEEDELDEASVHLEEVLAPEELHGLHMEYEANLERALRAIVTAQRGCAITRLPHRPPDDEEPFNYWKHAHQNIVHARMRMQEVLEVLLAWEPGKRAEVSVTTRLHRDTPVSR